MNENNKIKNYHAEVRCETIVLGEKSRIPVRRDISGSQSLLTVEWEGIQTGDHPDDSVGGFAVEYRAEKDTQWHVHDGIIPYKGPNLQYRVQVD